MGTHFIKTTLVAIGLRVQIGHPDFRCANPIAGHKNFTVVDVSTIHHVAVDFCGCERRVSHRQKLLRAQWFPATVDQPRTCFTFRALEHFHALTLSGKLSAYEYYKTLERLTDNTEIDTPTVRPP